MYILLLTILFCTLTNGDDSNEEKYIDLLPEEEKQAFLERVARRLIQGIKRKDSKYKSSEELPDEELNQHSQFVSQVMKEESENMRRDIQDKKEKDSKESLRVQGVVQHMVSDVEDKNHVDLTLRQGRRSKRNKEETVSVKTIYDDDALLKTNEDNIEKQQEIAQENVLNKEQSGEKSTNEDIQVRGPKRQSRKANSALFAQPNVISNEATKIIDFEPDEVTESNIYKLKDTGEEEENKSVSSETRMKNKNLNPNGFTQAIYESQEESKHYKSSEESPAEAVDTTSVTVNSDSDSVSTTEQVSTSQTSTTVANNVTVTMEKTTEHISNNETDKLNKQHLRAKPDETFEVGFNQSSEKSYTITNNTEKVLDNDAYNSTEKMNNPEENIISNERLQGENGYTTNHTDSKHFKKTSEFNENIAQSSTKPNSSDTTYYDQIGSMNLKQNDYDESIPGAINLNLNNMKENKYHNTNKSDLRSGSTDALLSSFTESNIATVKAASGSSKGKKELNKQVLKLRNNKSDSMENKSNTDKINSSSFTQDGTSDGKSKQKEVAKDVDALKVKPKVNATKSYFNRTEKSSSTLQKKKRSGENNYKSEANVSVTDQLQNNSNSRNVKISASVVENQANKTILRLGSHNEHVLTTTPRSNIQTSFNDTSKTHFSQKEFNNMGVKPNSGKENKHHEKDKNLEKSAIKSENNKKRSKKNNQKDNKTSITDEGYVSQSVNLEKLKKTIKEDLSSMTKTDLEKHKETVSPTHEKPKEYIVYELPEGETPFIKQKSSNEHKVEHNQESLKQAQNQNQEFLNRENPYYVPIYNYSPNNAYYNAYNRFGPNEEENPEDENVKVVNVKYEDIDNTEDIKSSLEIHSLNDLRSQNEALRKFKFSGKKHQQMHSKSRVKSQTFNIPLPLVIKQPKWQNTYFNPDDYLDMDYYYGRSNQHPKFRINPVIKPVTAHPPLPTEIPPDPKSEGLNDPYHLLETEDVKNHLSAVRQILYRQQRFGFVPDIPSPSESTTAVNQDDDYPDVSKHFRSENQTDIIILLPNTELREVSGIPDDIAVDYYFGVSNNDKDGQRKHSKIFKNKKDLSKPKQNPSFANFLSKIRRRLDDQSTYRFKKRNDKKEDERREWKKNAGTVGEILSMSDPKDMFDHLDKLQKLNLSYIRRKNEDKDVEIYTSVLKDMIEVDNKALKQYDWLGSTIDIRSALDKLSDLTNQQKRQEAIHPADLQLLNYVVHIYTSAKSTLTDEVTLRGTKDKKKNKYLLPRSRKRKKEYLKAKGLINRVWLYIRGRLKAAQSEGKDELEDFGKFLEDLAGNLFDLHNALKHIAMVTKYNNQRFYENLRDVYIKDLKKKYLLEALLHLFMARFLGLVEDSAMNGLEDGYYDYIDRNTEEVERSKQELVFILKLMKEFKGIKVDDL